MTMNPMWAAGGGGRRTQTGFDEIERIRRESRSERQKSHNPSDLHLKTNGETDNRTLVQESQPCWTKPWGAFSRPFGISDRIYFNDGINKVI
jgi:hypothetical protein